MPRVSLRCDSSLAEGCLKCGKKGLLAYEDLGYHCPIRSCVFLAAFAKSVFLGRGKKDAFRFGLSCSTSSSFCVGRERAHVLDQASGFRDSFWELSNPVAEWSGAVLVELSTGLTAVPVLNPTSPGLNHRVSSLRSKRKACYVPRKVEGTYFL